MVTKGKGNKGDQFKEYEKRRNEKVEISIVKKTISYTRFKKLCDYIANHKQLYWLKLEKVLIKKKKYLLAKELKYFAGEIFEALKKNESLNIVEIDNLGDDCWKEIEKLFKKNSIKRVKIKDGLPEEGKKELNINNWYNEAFELGKSYEKSRKKSECEDSLKLLNKINSEIEKQKLKPTDLLGKPYQRVYENIAYRLKYLGRLKDSIEYWKKQIKVGIPDDPQPYVEIGNAYYYLGQYREALSYEYARIELEPKDPSAYLNAFQTLLKLRDARANDFLRKAYELVRDDPSVVDELTQKDQKLLRSILKQFSHILEQKKVTKKTVEDSAAAVYESMDEEKSDESNKQEKQENLKFFKNVFLSSVKNMLHDQVVDGYIQSNDSLYEFVKTFTSTFEEFYLSYKVLASGKVAQKDNMKDNFISGLVSYLSEAVAFIPGASAALTALKFIMDTLENLKDKATADKFSTIFSDITQANKIIKNASSALAKKQESYIQSLIPPHKGNKAIDAAAEQQGFITRSMAKMNKKKIDSQQFFKKIKNKLIFDKYDSEIKMYSLEMVLKIVKEILSNDEISSKCKPLELEQKITEYLYSENHIEYDPSISPFDDLIQEGMNASMLSLQ